MQETKLFNRGLQTKLNTTFQTELLKGIVQMGGRIAIIVTDDPRYLSRKLRTWTVLSLKDLHRTRRYNRHSKLAFIVRDLKELPAVAPFLSCVTLLRDSKNRRVTSLRSPAHPTGISTSLGNLELFLNHLATRPNPSHFAGSHAMEMPEYCFVLSGLHSTKPPPGIAVIGAPNTRKSTLVRLKERTTTEGALYLGGLRSDLFHNNN